jgi:hypothetical protein
MNVTKPPGLGERIQPISFPTAMSVTFDLNAFNEGIKAHGLRFVHYRCMRDVVGLIDKYDSRRPNPSSPSAINGLYYTRGGIVTALCLGNTKETKASDAGMVDSSTAQFTPINHYEDSGKRVFLAPGDRLMLEEESVLVTRHELLEASPTGIDRPKFPAVEVLDCIDAKGIRYFQSEDFDVTQDGLMVWKDRRPGQEVDTGKGVVFGIRYVYRPAWYVTRLVHEIRMVQSENFMTGERTMLQAPQSALVQREFVFESEAADTGTRMAGEAPADGQLTAK